MNEGSGGRGPGGSGRLWVAVQGALLLALVFLPAGPTVSALRAPRPLGWLLQALGACFALIAILALGRRSLTPLPTPREDSALKTDGPYRFVRHPIYAGVLLWALGYAVAAPGALRFLALAALCVFFTAKAGYEERLLLRRFSGYADYARHTPRFVPGWRPARLPAPAASAGENGGGPEPQQQEVGR